MSGMWELVLVPGRALRRASIAWSVALALLIGATVAFWPAFKGSSAISQAFDQMPSQLVAALGMQDVGSPAGFLRGNLWEFLIPLLMIGAAVAMANGQTAAEEDAGRLELYLAQPVSRVALWIGRAAAVGIAVILVAAVTLVAQLAFDAATGLDLPVPNVTATVLLSALLALLYAGLALAIAGFIPRPSLVLGLAITAAVAGYFVVALFPLNATLAPWRHVSPWDWAFGGGPLTDTTAAWRYLALAGLALGLAAIGALGFRRRDVRAG
ncbi:MAG TPA: ABC transporter permease subunit [Candidatus Limnocylindrales bacterium]